MKAPKILAGSVKATKEGEEVAAPGRFSNASLSAQTLLKLVDPTGTACIIFHDIRPVLNRTTLHMAVTLPLGQTTQIPHANGHGNDNSSEDDTTVHDSGLDSDGSLQLTTQLV